MKRIIQSTIIKVKLYYYTLLDYIEDKFSGKSSIYLGTEVIERRHQNTKLARGVRKLVRRLREMRPEDRTSYDNLLGLESYKKTRQEAIEELRARDKVLRNPILKTEDDLVSKVVKSAPAYAKEEDIREIRKAITACLRASGKDPSNPKHVSDMKALKAKLRLLKGEIARMKENS